MSHQKLWNLTSFLVHKTKTHIQMLILMLCHLRILRIIKIVGSNVTPRPQNQEERIQMRIHVLNYNQCLMHQRKTENYSAIPMLQNQDLYQNGNPSKDLINSQCTTKKIISKARETGIYLKWEPIY
ncbi:hypothetical protein CEXT_176481 [Caerostris extrusa]|uniref:Uncharacterized protein n=1 Tax=Caerostris extrusa TaxID=172846 RepID=A0AAV4UAI3_CAEEX|nr:hypothetical protein CEXT_176481 [Caerostris extrusa]